MQKLFNTSKKMIIVTLPVAFISSFSLYLITLLIFNSLVGNIKVKTIFKITLISLVISFFCLITGIQIFGDVAIIFFYILYLKSKHRLKQDDTLIFIVLACNYNILINQNLSTLCISLFSDLNVINNLSVLLSVIINYMLGIFVIHQIDKYKSSIRCLSTNRFLYNYVLVCSLIFFVLISLVILITDINGITASVSFFIVSITFIIFIIFSIILWILFKNSQSRKIKSDIDRQNKIFENYLSEITKYYENTVNLKHDIKNMLLSLDESIQNCGNQKLITDYTKIVSYIEKNTNSYIPNNDIILIGKIKSSYIRSILLNKLTDSKNLGVKLKLIVNDDFTIPSKLEFKLIRIISILIDNVIEYNSCYSQKKASISFLTEEDIRIISISNPIDSDNTISSWFEPGFTTKKNHSGRGLSIVQNLIENTPELDLSVSKDSNNIVNFTIEIEV